MNKLKWKRVYDQAGPSDGDRILVDQLWPRGVTHEEAAIDGWAKDITPSSKLRQDYHHGELDFDEFSEGYREELEANPQFPVFVDDLNQRLSKHDVTLVYAGKEAGVTHLPTLKRQLEKAGVESEPLPQD